MDQMTAKKIIQLQEQLMKDAAYTQLLAEYRICSDEFVSMRGELSQEQQRVLDAYMDTCVGMHLRMLEMACGEG